jgi:tetratricopeptide (TPR) repeat protein
MLLPWHPLLELIPMTRRLTLALFGALSGALLTTAVDAQARLISSMSSPRATVSQVVGVTDIHVDYGRPGVKGRTVMGNAQIVAYDAAQPWRAGANENTVIRFEHDVTIEGSSLPAGSYGLHMFPRSEGPWTVAFSNNKTSWGSYSYDPQEDQLRVEVAVRSGAFQERLEYEFQDLDKNGATLLLRWETIEVPLRIGVKTDDNVVAYLRDEYVRGYGFWNGQQLAAAAGYCNQNGVNLEQAEGWAQRAVGSAPSYPNYTLLAALQDKLGKSEAALATRALGEPLANENQRNAFGYTLLQSGQVAKALAVFETNLSRFPASWNAHDSLADACAAAGQDERALELYSKALELVSDDGNKARLEDLIRKLKG